MPVSSSGLKNPADFVLRLREWGAANWLRNVIVGAILLALLMGTGVAWLLLASLAVKADLITVQLALNALDEHDLERAETLAKRLRTGPALTTAEAGGPLFILGSIKAAHADSQWSAERERSDYLIAARYLGEARALGFPPGREDEALFLLGRSLLAGNELEAGIGVLEEALQQKNSHSTEIHALLCDAHLAAPTPRLPEAQRHNDALLSMELPSEQRVDALLTRAQILIGQQQFAAAHQTLDSLSSQEAGQSRREMLEGWLLLEHARVKLQTGAAGDPADAGTAAADLSQAEAKFIAAQSLDRLATNITRLSMYLYADAAAVKGDANLAIERFAATRKVHPETAEGIAAALREADLLRQQKDYDAALGGYRRALKALHDPKAYQNPWLPLDAVRSRFIEAHAALVAESQFASALAAVDDFMPLFDEERQVSLRAETLEAWGKFLRINAATAPDPGEQLREGRLHLRQAGVGFKQLARLQFATSRYVDDLWRSAECFYQGQNYTHAAETLNEYLNNEPQRRNAQALLRLGQCYLALGRLNEAIAAFEECIECQPYDAAIYQARIDCARAYSTLHDLKNAEQLLLENIMGGTLTPQSPEWRTSQFELGHLLHEAGRYVDAVKRLEEAVERYPDDPQARLARYRIAESYRHAAAAPLEALAAANTVSEREHLQDTVDNYLGNALRHYGDVQREIAAHGEKSEEDRAMRRNCYMLQGSVLFDLGRFKEAVEAYSNVATLYQNEPFVLETLVQIAHCWNRLNDNVKAHGQIEQAKLFLDRLPADADFVGSTNLTRQEWILLLDEMSRWWRQASS